MKKLFTLFIFFSLVLNIQAQDYQVSKITVDFANFQLSGLFQGPGDTVYVHNTSEVFKIDTLGQVTEVEFDCSGFCILEDIFVDANSNIYLAFTGSGGGLMEITPTMTTFLTSEETVAVAVGDDGTVYAGIENGGFSVYDGSDWTNYNTSNSGIGSDIVNDIAFDGNGNVWMTTTGGLSRLSNGTINNFTDGNLSATFYELGIASDETAWVASAFGGVGAYSGNSWTTFPSIFTPVEEARGIGINSEDAVWTTSGFGGSKVSKIENGEATLAIPFDELDLGSGSILRTFMVDSKDRIWMTINSSFDIAIIEEVLIDNTDELSNQAKHSSIAPNPHFGVCQLIIDSGLQDIADKNLLIYNSLGALVASKPILMGQSNIDLDLSKMPVGLYYYNIVDKLTVLDVGTMIRN